MLYSLFKQQVSDNSAKTAVVWRGETFSYAQLDQLACRYAAILRDCGLIAGDTVALLVPNGVHFVAGTLAAWANGCLLLPLNTGYKPEEVSLYIQSARARFAFVSDKAEALLPVSVDKRLIIDMEAMLPTEASGVFAPATVSAEQDAIVMFSSGSTGTPKQVVRSQGQLMAEIAGARVTLGLNADDVIMCSVPLFHAHGFGNCLLAALMNGGTLLIHQGEFNPRKVVKMMTDFRATIYPSVPFMCKTLAVTPFKEAPDFSTLRLVFTAGAPLDEQIFTDFKAKFGVSLGQLYGSTETGAAAINMKVDEGNFRSVGKPLAGTTIRLIDDEGGDVAPGEDGEVIISSPAMTHEYRGLAELSAETFQVDGYHTGDLGRCDADGNITLCGRKKLMINVAGYKVDPADVERVIMQLPGVSEVVVLGKPDAHYGETVKAAVVGSDSLTKEQVMAHCAQRLAEYKVPKIVEFIAEIPKSPLGKVLRKYL